MGNRVLRRVAVVALGLSAGFGGSLAAQTTTAPPDVLTALLEEVRGLRAAMEQMASAGPRIELALGRLQLQEQRLNNLLRRHGEVRERLAGVERQAELEARRVEDLQQAAESVFDETERKALRQQLAHHKAAHDQVNADLQRLRTEEADVTQLVALEQSRWTEINNRLEELERALTRR